MEVTAGGMGMGKRCRGTSTLIVSMSANARCSLPLLPAAVGINPTWCPVTKRVPTNVGPTFFFNTQDTATKVRVVKNKSIMVVKV